MTNQEQAQYNHHIATLQARIEDLENRSSPRDEVTVLFRKFRTGAEAPKPGTEFAAGSDLHAWLIKDPAAEQANPVQIGFGLPIAPVNGSAKPHPYDLTIGPGEMAIIPTGLNVRIPAGYEIQLRPRSGLAAKHQVTIMNSPGTVDADYDGDGEDFDVRVMVKNTHLSTPLIVKHGDRICQAVVKPVPRVKWVEVTGDNQNRLKSTRGGGLGSTGIAKL